MDNQKQKKKKSVMDTLSATMVLVLIALLLVFVGYTYLALKNGYTLDDLIDNIVGNLIGVLAAFLLFDILNNKLTQDAYARETSQQITKTLMGEPEILDSFSDEDKKTFLKSTITSMIKDEDAVDMLSTNMEKYFDRARGARIRKMFDYTINLEPNLTEEYVKAGFPGATDGKYYLIDEELKFSVKCLDSVSPMIKRVWTVDCWRPDRMRILPRAFSMRIWWWNRKLWTSSTVFPRTRSGM